jgi:uncharacterized protein (DUF1697 family)
MRYISLLRGINVGGHRIIKMAALRALYEDLGCRQVTSYLQSGNVVFETGIRNRSQLQAKLETAVEKTFGFAVPVELRTRQEWARVIAGCPFGVIDPATEGTRYLVVFLSATPSANSLAALRPAIVTPEELVFSGREAYWHCPNGVANSKLTNTLLERRLGVSATARNWRSVVKLAELAEVAD